MGSFPQQPLVLQYLQWCQRQSSLIYLSSRCFKTIPIRFQRFYGTLLSTPHIYNHPKAKLNLVKLYPILCCLNQFGSVFIKKSECIAFRLLPYPKTNQQHRQTWQIKKKQNRLLTIRQPLSFHISSKVIAFAILHACWPYTVPSTICT